MPTPRAVIFDLDDTLITTHAASAQTWSYLHTYYATSFGISAEKFERAIAKARRSLWDDPARHSAWRNRMSESPGEILRMACGELGLNCPPDRAERFTHEYTERFFGALALFPDARAVLDALQTRGIRLAMITNGETKWQQRKIAAFALAPLFEPIVIEQTFGAGKPDPSVYKHVLKALDVTPGATWMIGDRLDWDVLAPQALGITGVWFDFHNAGLAQGQSARAHTPPGEPDHIVRALAELPALLGA